MPTTEIVKQGFKCARCGWAWVPRIDAKKGPKVCPNCKRTDWNKPPQEGGAGTGET